MAITKRNPNTIHLGGHATFINDVVASGQTIVAGDQLSAADDGTLKKRTGTQDPMFVALEAKTTTALTRIRAEAL